VASGRDPVLVEIERGLLEAAELSTILTLADLKPGRELAERAKAARRALERTP
jgi:hypothetical protein